jgi:hypothetical protein
MNFTRGMFGYAKAQVGSTNYAYGDEAAQLLVLGDSTIGMAFVAYFFPLGRSLAVPNGTPIELYYQLSRYLKHNTPPKMILFSFKNNLSKMREIYWFNYTKTGLYDWNDAVAISKTGVADGRYPMLSDEPLHFGMYRYLTHYLGYRTNFFPLYLAEIQGHLSMTDRQYSNWSFYRFAREYRGFVVLAQDLREQQIPIINIEQPYVRSDIFDTHLRMFFELAAANKITLVFVDVPVAPNVRNERSAEFLAGIKQHVAQYMQNYPDGLMLETDSAAYGEEDFGDDVHLSTKGVVKFSREVVGELLKRYPEKLKGVVKYIGDEIEIRFIRTDERPK